MLEVAVAVVADMVEEAEAAAEALEVEVVVEAWAVVAEALVVAVQAA